LNPPQVAAEVLAQLSDPDGLRHVHKGSRSGPVCVGGLAGASICYRGTLRHLAESVTSLQRRLGIARMRPATDPRSKGAFFACNRNGTAAAVKSVLW
jgi:hypothetical protein